MMWIEPLAVLPLPLAVLGVGIHLVGQTRGLKELRWKLGCAYAFRRTERKHGKMPYRRMRGYTPYDLKRFRVLIGDDGVRVLRRHLVADLFFPLVYAAAFLVGFQVANTTLMEAAAWPAAPFGVLVALPAIMLASDLLEDLCLLGYLRQDGLGPALCARIASVATCAKLWSISLAIAICTYLFIAVSVL